MRLGSVLDTLLSPERTTWAGLYVFPEVFWGGGWWLFFLPGGTCGAYRPLFVGGVGVLVVVSGWSLVENCTVDASIFVFCG